MEASIPVITRPRSIPGQLLAPTEQIIFELKPSLWFIPFESCRWLLGCLLLWGMLYVDANHLARSLIPHSTRYLLAQMVVAILLLRLLWAGMQWLGRTYVLTNLRVIRVRGVLNLELFECPLSKIQNTQLRLPLAQRIVHTGNIDIFTAGTDRAEASWIMVKRPVEVLQTLQNAITQRR